LRGRWPALSHEQVAQRALQFSLTWPKFDRYGVSLWIPSLGGQFDPENTVHDMAMTITDGLSKSERQRVQKRVRAAMAAQGPH
jgi:site-specific DNA recombinase